MKILHVTPYVSLVRGGISQAVLEMIRALRSQGLDVELAATNDNGADLLDVPLLKRVEYCQIPVWFFPRFSPKVAAIREFQFSGEFTSWLWQHIHEYDLLHIHAMFCYPCTVAMMIARIKQVPYINQPHGLLCEWSLQQSRLKKQVYLSLIERDNLIHSQALQFTSQMERQEVSQLELKVPSIVSPLGLFVSDPIAQARQKLRQKLNVPEDQPIILFMSRLHHKKGLDYLIPALGQLTDHPFTFVLAGNGDCQYEAEIDALLIEAGIQERTHRPGFVTGEFKDLLLQGSDIFALTSHSENFGVVVLEAMAAGLATILTPGVATAAILEEHQVGYVPALEVSAITEALRHCLENPDETKAIGDRARHLIFQHYTWERVADSLIQTYTEMIEPDQVSA
jgi:glycosyltransferase involved in cell wall biosynthesis